MPWGHGMGSGRVGIEAMGITREEIVVGHGEVDDLDEAVDLLLSDQRVGECGSEIGVQGAKQSSKRAHMV